MSDHSVHADVDLEEADPVAHIYREAGLRLNEPMAPELFDYLWSPGSVFHETLAGVHAFDKAHTVMLVEEGLIDESVGRQLLEALRGMEETDPIEVRKELGGHFHTGEVFLTETLGKDIGGRIHIGRSTADLTAVGSRWANRENLLGLMDDLNELREALLEKAVAHVETVMPGYSHLQHAQPTTFAHYLMSFVHALERDFERLQGAYDHTNISPAGAGVLTGSGYNVDRTRTAELLGFDDLYTNTMDANFNSEWGLETHSALMTMYSTITKLGTDMTLFATYEYDFVDHADRFCGTSSIMPQKKNPYMSMLTEGSTGTIYGNAWEAFINCKTSHGHIGTIRGGYAGLWDSYEFLSVVFSLLPEFVRTLEINEDVMHERANAHWAQATDVADTMVRELGIPFRTAHMISAVLVRQCIEADVPPGDVTTDHLDAAAEEVTGEPSDLSANALADALDAESCVDKRTLIGGPSPERVTEDIDESRDRLRADADELDDRRERLDEGASKLEAAIDEILGA